MSTQPLSSNTMEIKEEIEQVKNWKTEMHVNTDANKNELSETSEGIVKADTISIEAVDVFLNKSVLLKTEDVAIEPKLEITKINDDLSISSGNGISDPDDETLLAEFLKQTEEESVGDNKSDFIRNIIERIPEARKSIPQRVTEQIIKNCIEFKGTRLSLGTIIKHVEKGRIDLKKLNKVSEEDVAKLLANVKKEANISLPHLIAKHMVKHPKSRGNVDESTCQICFKKFNDKQTLLRHFRNHSGIKPFECLECGKKFSSKFNLKVHFRTHTGERPYKCFICDMAFTQQSSLNLHFRIHSGETPYGCSVCGKQFKQRAELTTHLRVHSGDKPFECPFCDKKFAHRSNFVKHKRMHHADREEKKIAQSDNAVESEDEKNPQRKNSKIIDNILSNTLMGEKGASTCNKYNVSIPELVTLNMIKLPEIDIPEQFPERPFQCDICKKDFKERHTLLRHYRNHSGIKPFTCSECGKRFSNKFNLQVHFRRHSGERPYRCVVCDHRFTQQSALNLHFRIHSGETPFECTECGKQFKQQSELDAHSRQHTGIKPYSCDECDRKFAHQSNLIKHKRVHSGVKPYECKDCGQKFTNKSNLNRHMKLHTGERPYTCDTCGKGYIQLADLARHSNTHNKVQKRFTCLTCGQKFEDGNLLLDHAQTHVKDEDSN